MINVNIKSNYSNILIFKFKNFELEYPDEIKNIIKFSKNLGDFNQVEQINTLGNTSYEKIIVLGLGDTEELNVSTLMDALGSTIRSLKNSIDGLDLLDNLPEDMGYYLGQSVSISLYKYNGIRQNDISTKLKDINLISDHAKSIEKGILIGDCVNFSRELTNKPSNIVTPKYMAQQAEKIAKEENLDLDILDKYRLEQLGMNAIVAVSSGSIHSPRLIALQYLGDADSKEITSFIGKGVTFDSGGLSLKPSKGMDRMTGDMAGAASVLALMKAVGKLKPKKNIIALIPVVENMPSGTAYRPGDVIKTYSGKTVEVISTDAEGRLILCDAISYARELGATKIIDVATLTGSSANFLGGINIGLYTNSKVLGEEIVSTGKETGENFWILPNNSDYRKQLETDAADMRNTGTSCGAIVAGAFLEAFAEDTEFAHMDIAGCSSTSKPEGVYESGAKGTPARTLIELVIK